jgi:putative spermidine/putrescine transport system permease protein
VRSPLLGIGLFLLCTVPFWTSNIIRMISWIPLLGKEGLINMSLIKLGVVHEPLEFLLFSSFSVVVAYVHQLTIFMVVPIFNAMARIDKRVSKRPWTLALVASTSCASSCCRSPKTASR